MKFSQESTDEFIVTLEGAVAPIDPIDRGDHHRARLQIEVRRIYRTSAWVGPIGAGALTIVAVGLLRGDLPAGRLLAWAGFVAVGVGGQAMSVVSPSIRGWEASSGLPRTTYVAHGVIGVAYGLLPWLDADMVDRSDLRWLALMLMFAMSAGVASGLNGLDVLGLCVLAPMWTIGPLALFLHGEWLVAVGGLLFLAIQIVDQRRSGVLWRELIALRLEQERRTEQQRWIAQHDDLTGLLNRAGVMAALAQTRGRSAAAMYVDLDHFKAVNDRMGHPAGDEVLVEVARRLRETVRDDDVVGRLGGDEFFIVFHRPLTSDRIDALGSQIIESIEVPIETASGRAEVSASVGAATIDGRVESGDQLMAHADHALLRAKRRGRNRVETHGGAVSM